jgi:hypothetical protein
MHRRPVTRLPVQHHPLPRFGGRFSKISTPRQWRKAMATRMLSLVTVAQPHDGPSSGVDINERGNTKILKAPRTPAQSRAPE